MKWIWCKDAEGINQYADFISEFTVDEIKPDAIIKICTEGEYVLYINEEFVACGQFDDYGEVRTYDEINISKFLLPGKNELLINAYHQGESSYQYSVGDAGLCFEITNGDFVLKSSKNVLCAPSDIYVCGSKVHKTTIQYGYGYICDASKSCKREFLPSVEKQMPPLQKRPIKKCNEELCAGRLVEIGTFVRKSEGSNPGEAMYNDILMPKAKNQISDKDFDLVKSSDSIYLIYDLGEEKSGYFTMDIEASEGTVADIGYGEHINDGRVRTKIDARCFANRYVCSSGRQKFTYYFRRIAGRYIQINFSGRVNKINFVGILNSLYPLKLAMDYTRADDCCKRILDVCVYTLRMCMHEHYEDCPWREGALYGSDCRNQMLFGYYAFEEYDFAGASLELVAKSVGDDGFISIACPSDSQKRIPSFTFIWLLAMKEYIEYSGDISLANKYAAVLKKIAEERMSEIKNSLAAAPQGENYWNFYEWSHTNDGFYIPTDETEVEDGLYNIFLYIGLDSLKKIFDRIEESETAQRINRALPLLKNKINETFYDDERDMYASFVRKGKKDAYSKLTQTMALYSGVADLHSQRMCELLTEDNELTNLTISYLVYKYDALLGVSHKYRNYIQDEIKQKWGKMLSEGATTFWETEEGEKDFDNAGSLCHGWSATPIYVYGRYFK